MAPVHVDSTFEIAVQVDVLVDMNPFWVGLRCVISSSAEQDGPPNEAIPIVVQ